MSSNAPSLDRPTRSGRRASQSRMRAHANDTPRMSSWLNNAEYLHERLPNSKLDLIDAGHFVWEDAADEYAALVTRWWSGGHAGPA
jgi:pimeloyl-ACP methyl ester carboxylesterase